MRSHSGHSDQRPPWGRVSFRPPSLSSPSLISLRCERGHHWNPRRPSSGGGFSLRRCLTLSFIILSTSISSSPFNSDEELRLKGGSPEGRTPEQLPGLTNSTQVRPLGSNVSECGTARLAPQSPLGTSPTTKGRRRGVTTGPELPGPLESQRPLATLFLHLVLHSASSTATKGEMKGVIPGNLKGHRPPLY